MIHLKGTAQGWAKLHAQIDQKKKKVFEFDINYHSNDSQSEALVHMIDMSDESLTKEEKRCIEQQNDYYIMKIIFSQRISQKLPGNQFDAFEYSYTLNVYLEDESYYDKLANVIQDTARDIENETGIKMEITSKTVSVSIPKKEDLDEEVAYDDYGNKFEVGDMVARSDCSTSATRSDVIVGTTTRSLLLLSGTHCDPRKTFVIKKGKGNTIYRY